MKPLVNINNLTVAFGEHSVIKSLDCQIMAGDFFIVFGDNGVGKTTLIRTLLGSLHPQGGEITRPSNRQIGYVPQFRNLDSEYPLAIREFVALNYNDSYIPWQTRREKQHIQQALTETNLQEISRRPLGLASGGEKQRAYLAQALVNRPRLLILDEATASLDNTMKYELLDLVAKLQKQGLTVLFVTHDLPLAKRYGTRFLKMTRPGYHEGVLSDFPEFKEVH
ncbi:ATP-binding cassette domain-containing protein [uncultured Limosilactobacillus sp.]|uniref:metal ABC transporter ATP-binding protein n=1 Tax=uncultured Limosilactobacillus sp. TaxID=2837629 RepID=UPI0025ED6FAC|nr:ATP-binding cassette domain-containing protein [uncultured Limosilactobacillus sp.]